MFVHDGHCNLFIIIAAICEHDNVMGIMRTDRVFQAQLLDRVNDKLMLGLILHIVLLTITFALEGDRRERNQRVVEEKDNVGPLMSDDKPLAMIEGFGIFRMHTGAMLDRTINQDRNLPG